MTQLITPTTHKLTKNQAEAMRLLADGWTIVNAGYSISAWKSDHSPRRIWFERGSEIEPMHPRVFDSLCRHGLIRREKTYRTPGGEHRSMWVVVEVAQ